MKKFKKFTAIALAGVMAMSVLAGCGKGSETSGENNASGDGGSNSAQASGSVEFWHDNKFGDAEQADLDKVFGGISKLSGVTLNRYHILIQRHIDSDATIHP